PQEAPEKCAERELMEEIGMKPRKLEELGTLYPTPGICNELQYLYLAEELTEATATHDDDEVFEVVELSVKEVKELIAGGQLSDAKSISIFCRASLRGLV